MEDLLTVKQVSILLKVHQLTVRRYINEGKLQAIRVGGNIRISQREVQAFSQSYTPHAKVTKAQNSTNATEPFGAADALFRLKSRGLSLENFNK